MILSGTIALDPDAHAAATAALRLHLEQLEDRRCRAQHCVEHVLSSWSGDAAELFRSRWLEWNHGALAVIDQLTAAADALDQARRDLTCTDERSAGATTRLAGRLR
jgi:WXG100 family type VII secretion target